MYLLRLSLRPWRVAPFSQVFSSFAVGVLLLLVAFLFWMHQGLTPILERLHGEQVVTAYLSNQVESKDEAALLEHVRHSIKSQSAEVKLVSTAEFLAQIKSQYPELEKELMALGQDISFVVPRYISITGILPSSILDKVSAIPGIERTETSKDRYRNILGAFSALRWVARVLIAGILLALLTGLIHLARMNGYLHKDALNLLRFWGAGRMKLFLPSAVSGALVGLGGGGIAWVGWATTGVWLSQHIRSLSVLLKGMPMASSQLGIFLLVAGGIVGLLSGTFGTLAVSSLGAEGGQRRS